jgi:hypothetical protein
MRYATASMADSSPPSHDEVLAGFGSGLPCAFCNKPIESTQVEYEVRRTVDGGADTKLQRLTGEPTTG